MIYIYIELKTVIMKNLKEIQKTAEQTLKLSDISKGSFLYCLAQAEINENGFYSCVYQEKKTLILK